MFKVQSHTPCGRTCACAVACLYPRNSISNVVASLKIHDNIYIYINVRCSKNTKPLWKVINIYMCAHTYTFTHVHIHVHLHLQLHIHLHIHIYICIYTHTQIHVHVHIHVHLHVRLRVRVRVGVVVGGWVGW